ncbi:MULTISPECIES: helix-turn-helix domain-containing protein [Arsenicicoccus]|uniref:helix-turn-helix domain-containing protein n=1 Tax=Arsenicicoccus TaxID=267408 RepID=UPI00257AB5BE|nr:MULTISPECIES: helix-turn-helix transcriptional regulator [Arsenicicoccus]
MSDENGFGVALRAARVAAGLSQSELGEPEFSRSYISLVESGHRAPSREIVEHVAGRLGLSVEHVRAWALASGKRGDARAAVLQTEALSVLTTHTFEGAIKAASDLRDFALEADRLDLWWTAALMDLTLRIENDFADQVVEQARALVDHWFTQQSTILQGRVRTVLSVALRVTGDLEGSVTEARAAVMAFRTTPTWRSTGVAALTALVSALGQQHRYSDAISWAPDLARGAQDAPNRLEAGNAYWALANLALSTGDPEAGLSYYDQAIAAIDPDGHLRRWGRVHRAAADFRLKADVDLDAVPGLLAKAATAFSLSSARSDQVELDLVQGKYACATGDWAQGRAHMERVLEDGHLLAASDLADAHHHLGTALGELGDHRGAAEHLQESVRLLLTLTSTNAGPA